VRKQNDGVLETGIGHSKTFIVATPTTKM
jgi:hypothetical protein